MKVEWEIEQHPDGAYHVSWELNLLIPQLRIRHTVLDISARRDENDLAAIGQLLNAVELKLNGDT